LFKIAKKQSDAPFDMKKQFVQYRVLQTMIIYRSNKKEHKIRACDQDAISNYLDDVF